MILVDTNIVIAYLNGDKIVTEKVLAQIDNIALSTLVIAELDYGAKASQNAGNNLEKLYKFLDIIQVIPFDRECAKTFGTIKSKLRNVGRPTGEVDALIAATAMTHKTVLVTANKKHYENIEGLKIDVW